MYGSKLKVAVVRNRALDLNIDSCFATLIPAKKATFDKCIKTSIELRYRLPSEVTSDLFLRLTSYFEVQVLLKVNISRVCHLGIQVKVK